MEAAGSAATAADRPRSQCHGKRRKHPSAAPPPYRPLGARHLGGRRSSRWWRCGIGTGSCPWWTARQPRRSAASRRRSTCTSISGGSPPSVLDDVEIANADGFDANTPFAHADKLTVEADVMAYIHDARDRAAQDHVDHPVVDAEQRADKSANWPTGSSSSEPAGKKADPNAGPKIGDLVINDGHAHVVLAPLKADFNLDGRDQGGQWRQPDARPAIRPDRRRGEGHLCRPTDHRAPGLRCAALAARFGPPLSDRPASGERAHPGRADGHRRRTR